MRLRVKFCFSFPQVRDKEEELETAMQKIDSLRNDIRKADKSRREYESRIDDVIAEATKVCTAKIDRQCKTVFTYDHSLQERKLRERSEEYCRQLQAEVRTRSTSDFGSSSSISADASRMEIERLEAS